MTTINLMSSAEWLRSTAQTLGVRDKFLKAIDDRIVGYHGAKSAYGRAWETSELRIALDRWKSQQAKDGGWKKSPRNKPLRSVTFGPFEWLDIWLPSAAVVADTKPGQDLREWTLRFFKECRTEKLPTDVRTMINQGDEMTKVASLGSATAGKEDFNQGVGKKFLDTVIAFLNKLGETTMASLREHGSYCAGLIDSLVSRLGDLLTLIKNSLPEILKTIIGGALSQLDSAKDFISGLADAGDKIISYVKSRNLAENIAEGAPRDVIDSLRSQLADGIGDGFKKAALAAVKGGSAVLNPAVGAFVGAVANVYVFLSDTWFRYKQGIALDQFFAEAKVEFDANTYGDPQKFNRWFKGALAAVPIVAAFSLANPMTGGYYGFLTLIGTDGTQMSYRELERNLVMFGDIKKVAREVISGYPVKIYSADNLANHALQIIAGGGTVDVHPAMTDKYIGQIKAGIVDRLKAGLVDLVKAVFSSS